MKDERDYIPLDDRVRLIRIRTFFENVAGNPFGFMLGGGLFVLALHGTGVSDAILFSWLALLSAIALHLPTNGRFVAIHHSGNVTFVMSGFVEDGNLVTFVLGEV